MRRWRRRPGGQSLRLPILSPTLLFPNPTHVDAMDLLALATPLAYETDDDLLDDDLLDDDLDEDLDDDLDDDLLDDDLDEDLDDDLDDDLDEFDDDDF